MDFKINYNRNGIVAEFTGISEEEYVQCYNMLQSLIALEKPVIVEHKEEPMVVEKKPVKPASDKQKALMDKWGIEYPANASSADAVCLINGYKLAHGMEIRPNPYQN